MYVPVATPHSEAELAVMLGLLVACDIPHYVHNRHFSALIPGPTIELYNRQRVMVAAEVRAEAVALLAPFFAPSPEYEAERRLTIVDRMRVIVELLIFGWFVPYRFRRPSATDEDNPGRAQNGT